jgi:hypothetical protein
MCNVVRWIYSGRLGRVHIKSTCIHHIYTISGFKSVAVRTAMCGSVWQCAAVCGSVRQCVVMRVAVCVCLSLIIKLFVLNHIKLNLS